MDLPEWKLYALEMDDAGRKIGEFFQQQGFPIERVNPAEGIEGIAGFVPDFKKNIDKKVVEKGIADCIKTDSRVLALYGHGSYHFFTYGLAMLANRLISNDFGYIHIDNHHDTWFDNWDRITCGAFVQQICQDTHVYGFRRNILYIGDDTVEEKPKFFGAGMFGTGLLRNNNLDIMLHEKMPDDVYLTIDLDVMHREEVRTAFERGDLRLDELKTILRNIKQKKRIISADICGFAETTKPYADPDYLAGRDISSFEQSMKVYKELSDIIMEN
ncbi:MAG: arginase family protein [Nanoarchaeota archaeon]|nr:arginase family protein [Nanoarchaeota archaeon]